MNFWIMDHINNIDIEINRFSFLSKIIKGNEKQKFEEITKLLNDQKISLQKIIENDV